MKNTLSTLTTSVMLTSFLSACSILPQSSEPELGAALASPSLASLSEETHQSGHGTTLIVNDVLFDFEKAELHSGADKIVSRAVDYLRSNPDSEVTIEGHTDHIGPKSYNQKLSEKRANAIANALKENGISADRISTIGYGETKPLASNDTADGRRTNRRVELILQKDF